MHLPPRLGNKALPIQPKPPGPSAPDRRPVQDHTSRRTTEVTLIWNLDFITPTNDFRLLPHVYLSLNNIQNQFACFQILCKWYHKIRIFFCSLLFFV